MYGGLTGFGMHPSLGGLLVGGAKSPRVQKKYATERPYVRSTTKASETFAIKQQRAMARKLQSEQNKAIKKSPIYKAHVKAYHALLKDYAKHNLRQLTAEESMVIEEAIRMGQGDRIPYLIQDRNQHERLLKAKHFPMWAATENVFEYGLPRKEKMFTMGKMFPYKSRGATAIESAYYGPEMAQSSPLLIGNEPLYSARVPRGLSSFMSGEPTGLGLPRRRGTVRGPTGQFISPSSEEFLQVVPYSEY
jgi:hypothetical protein